MCCGDAQILDLERGINCFFKDYPSSGMNLDPAGNDKAMAGML